MADARALPAETVALDDALGRVLTEDLTALRTQPPAAVSAMDGYAVRAADVAQAPAKLKLIGEVAAGHPFEGEVKAGQAARIFTGGVMPAGADTVVIQELTARDGDTVTIQKATAKGRNVRGRGIDFTQGQPLLRKGRRLTDRDLMLAAAMNYPTLSVHRRPKVAVLGTGDELVAPGSTPEPGEIVYSNGFALMAMARSEGAEVSDLGIAPDRHRGHRGGGAARARLGRRYSAHQRRRLGRRARPGAAGARQRRARSVVLAGGAAPRPADDAWPAGRHAGARRARQSGIVLCLRLPVPGAADPAACRPRRCRARSRAGPTRAATCRPMTSGPTICGRPCPTGPDGPVATPLPAQDSSLMAPLAKADCLLIRAPNAPAAAAGSPCVILKLAL